ncbi:MAG: TSCPD domain-containing protein [Bacteroidales bacterium]|nr:TSCPD domain-containing protein [Bacteroidales bacterium]
MRIKNTIEYPPRLTKSQINYIYASEADIINMALFEITAKEWREQNPDLQGNMRDYAEINQLICLANLENINSVLIEDDIPRGNKLTSCPDQLCQALKELKRQ